jgi:hypothetical protein
VYLGLWAAGTEQRALQREMRRRAESLCRLLRTFSRMYPVGQTRAHLIGGHCHWLNGRPGRARRAWRRSLAAAERYRMPCEQAQAHLELGRHGRPDDPESRAHLERARELLARIGVRHDPPAAPG